MKRFVVTAILMASALLYGGVAGLTAAETVHLSKQQVKQLVATAETPAEHMKLAAYFNQEADKLDAEAKYHEGLASVYRSNPAALGTKNRAAGEGGAMHCDNFAKSMRGAATEDRALAAEHEQMAKEATK
jgi:ATP:corrinoid adenosyltransferase